MLMGLGKKPKDYPPAHCDKCGKVTPRTRGGVCHPCNVATLAKARANITTSRRDTGIRSWETRKAKAAAGLMGIEYNKRNPAEGQKLVEMARERVAADAVKVFKKHAALAADVLVDILKDKESRPETKIQAAKEVLSRALGAPVTTSLIGSLDDSEVVRLTGQDIMAAARRLVSANAIDVEAE
jgi:hypothetical protein